MKHLCIKCRSSYEDKDVEDYYCSNCFEEKKIIAAQIDAKFANRISDRPLSPLQIYEQQAKTTTLPNGRKISFMRA